MAISVAITPDGRGSILESETVRGSTSYRVSGVGFEGWYPESKVTVVDSHNAYQYGNIHDASWKEVRDKAKRLKSTNQVNVTSASGNELRAIVHGDTGIYDVEIHRKNAHGEGVTWWDCDCEWGKRAWNRFKYLGRMCSHTLAAYYQMQGMSNRKKTLASIHESKEVNYAVSEFIWWAEENHRELIFIDQIIDAINDFRVDRSGPNSIDYGYDDNYSYNFDVEDVLALIYEMKEDTSGPVPVLGSVDSTGAETFVSWLQARAIISDNAELSAFDDRTMRSMIGEFEKSGSIVSSSEEIIQQLKRSFGYNPANPLAQEHEFAGTNIPKTAGRMLTFAEQQELIDEEGTASQLSSLNLHDTFYL
jgi:hypothetical protein